MKDLSRPGVVKCLAVQSFFVQLIMRTYFPQSGKVHFGYIYGVGLLGCSSMYVVLNLMSSINVSVGCVVSVLGYCLLPMVLLSSFSVVVHLQ